MIDVSLLFKCNFYLIFFFYHNFPSKVALLSAFREEMNCENQYLLIISSRISNSIAYMSKSKISQPKALSIDGNCIESVIGLRLVPSFAFLDY